MKARISRRTALNGLGMGFVAGFAGVDKALGQVVASETGPIARAAPGVPVIDLFADLPAFRPQLAAYLLAAYGEAFEPGDVILAVVDPDEERAETVADEYGCKAFTSAAELIDTLSAPASSRSPKTAMPNRW